MIIIITAIIVTNTIAIITDTLRPSIHYKSKDDGYPRKAAVHPPHPTQGPKWEMIPRAHLKVS
jgi:hypothetical protein